MTEEHYIKKLQETLLLLKEDILLKQEKLDELVAELIETKEESNN